MKENILQNEVSISINSLINLLCVPFAIQSSTLEKSELTSYLDKILCNAIQGPFVFDFSVEGLCDSELEAAKLYLEEYFCKKFSSLS